MAAPGCKLLAFSPPVTWRVRWGGIIMAHFGDLVGRKKMFTLSILLMALPTLGDRSATDL